MHKEDRTRAASFRNGQSDVRDESADQSWAVRLRLFRGCTLRKKNCSGYENLPSHAHYKHPKRYETLQCESDETQSRAAQVLRNLFFNRKTQSLYAWIDLVLSGPPPFLTVQNPIFYRYKRYDPISRSSLTLNSEKPTYFVKPCYTRYPSDTRPASLGLS